MTVQHADDREAHFLESHEKRNANLSKTHRKSQALAVTFWKALWPSLQQWDEKIDAIQASVTVTTKQRREASDSLDFLEVSLNDLQGKSLSLNDVDLPMSEIRLVHKEFSRRATRLEQVRKEVSPPTKFAFHRYRAAMNEQSLESLSKKTIKAAPGCRKKIQVSSNSLNDLRDVSIVEERDGKIRIQSKSGDVRFLNPTEKNSSTIVLLNLISCQVEISCQYMSFHLQNVINSRVVISQPIEGAIHITGCDHLELKGSCHQLRLHECKNLQCRVQVGSGPILEDCTDIVFFASSDNNLLRDTKDFSWLRNGVPSPNYFIVDDDENGAADEDSRKSVGKEIHESSSLVGATTGLGRSEISEERNEESDDEL